MQPPIAPQGAPYRWNPYSNSNPKVFDERASVGKLRWTEAKCAEETTTPQKKLFIGQIPRIEVSKAAIVGMLLTISTVRVTKVQRIERWSSNRRSTGTFHVFCKPEDAEKLLAANQRAYCTPGALLYHPKWTADDLALAKGQAQAQTDGGRQHLCPNGLLTVQVATSDYRDRRG